MKSVAIAVACTLLACGASTRPRLKYGYYSGPTISGTVTSVTAGSGLTGGTITRSGTIAADTSVVQSRVSGTCTGSNAIQTVNADGTVTCVAAGGGGGSVTSVGTGTGLTGGPITTTGTIALANTAVTAGSYTLPVITVNAQGQLTAASDYVGTSCGAGTAIQLLSAAGAASCVTVGSGTVTSVATTAPITGGTITTGGTIGLNESSNLRTSGGALDLSTAVTMPGSLTIQDIYDTVTSQTLGSGTVTWTPTAGASYISLTCNAAGTTISTITAPSAGRTIDVTVPSSSGTCTFASGGNVMTPGGVSFPVVGGESFRIAFGGTNWFLETRGHPTKSCGAGSHFNAVDAAGNITCTADSGGITGTLTSPDLVVATGTSTVGNYAGSSCSAGTAATSIAATGALTCSITPITGTLTSGKVPLANGTSSLTSSDIDKDDGTVVGFFTGGAEGAYLTQNSLNFGYSYAANGLTSKINATGASGGTTFDRNLEIDNGKGAAIMTLTGSTKATELFGALQVDSSAQVRGAFSVYNNGTIPTISGCGTGATIASESSNNAGTITLGTTPGTCIVTFSAATGYTFTNAPACTVSPGSSAMKGGLYISISSTALTINDASLGASGDKIFYTCTGEKN